MQLIRGNKKVPTYVDWFNRRGVIRYRLTIPYRIAHAFNLTAPKLAISTEDVIISQLVSRESLFIAEPHICPGMKVTLTHDEEMPIQLIVRRGVWKEVGFE